MVNTVTFQDDGEEKVQTIKFIFLDERSESYSGTHNPKAAGSSPAPATKHKAALT